MTLKTYLEGNGLLKTLTKDEVDSIIEKFERVSLQPGEVLFKEDGNTKDIYVLESGN